MGTEPQSLFIWIHPGVAHLIDIYFWLFFLSLNLVTKNDMAEVVSEGDFKINIHIQ